MVSMDGSGTPVPIVQTRAREGQARLSVDGTLLVYVSDESGRNEVYVQAFRDPATRRQVSQAGGSSPRWRADGREVYFLAPGRDQLWAADVAVVDGAPQPGIPRLLFKASRRLSDYDVTADGARFLLAPDAPREAGAISAILNWQALLR
jgi:Tol biopolymer transport system component